MRAEALSRKPGCAGAVAFSRTGDPSSGDFSDAKLIRKFGDVPDDLARCDQHGPGSFLARGGISRLEQVQRCLDLREQALDFLAFVRSGTALQELVRP